MQQQMESRDEETLELRETYTSLQQEVDIKTKKLKKVDTTHSFGVHQHTALLLTLYLFKTQCEYICCLVLVRK